jgi:hypothetical protein
MEAREVAHRDMAGHGGSPARAVHGRDAATPVSWSGGKVNGEVGEHQELTPGPAEAMVGAERGGAVLTTCERPVRWSSEHGAAASTRRRGGGC